MSIYREGRVRAWLCAAASAAALGALAPSWAVAQPTPQALSLPEAIARASGADPTAPAAAARLAAAEANVRQAGVRLNPSLGVELGNFAGTGAYSLLERSETTLAYEQVFERGGKRQARTAVAAAELRLVEARREVRRLDLIKAVQSAYAEALAAEAELLIADARLIAAQKSQADIDRRVNSARDPLFAGARAETLTSQAEIARDTARQNAADTKAALAAYWGGGPDFKLDLETFYRAAIATTPIPVDTPDLTALAAARDVALARVSLERARQATDPILRASVRYFRDVSDVAFVVGGSVPLRLYDRNTAGVERALAERNATEIDIVAARIERDREIARIKARMALAASETERLRAEATPAAIRTVEQVLEGFNRGGFRYSDVTEAERALADVRARRVAILRQFHLDQASLDRLTGRHAAPTSLTEPRS